MKRPLSPLLVPLLVVSAFLGALGANRIYRIPTYEWETKGIPRPARTETVVLRVAGLKCRHSSVGMKDLLFGRKDRAAVRGYLKVRIFPSPGAGEMEVTFDPAATNVKKIAGAVKMDDRGQYSPYRVLLEEKPDLSTPKALLHSLARAMEDRNEDLFHACHEGGAWAGADFTALCRTWGELFLEDLTPAGEPDAEGWVKILGVVGGEGMPLDDLGCSLTRIRLVKTTKGWLVAEADWKGFRL